MVAIAEREGGIYNENGLDIEAVFKSTVKRRVPSSTSPVRRMSRTPCRPLELDCDVLVPAALETRSPLRTLPHQGQGDCQAPTARSPKKPKRS